ncbi:conserved hypothetical protein (plasmid) [Desulforapulum autotrophicum HRM2]|uniref:Uncharacterized protein n=1 Tax=Desulforapulum autotrophicum (strain ATCC 43914 / DSM 3382 / VKM B-1955 / HRM2) TaxID=177437 RepID=C0QMR1_DESAH|nr:conserved hypothetical protein [Desulforapulum autotrophicum HRM2]
MTKKDRIAIVVSIVYAILPLLVLFEEPAAALLFCLPIILYWGYRFIKNDISFIGNSNDSAQ